ncbi:MULTISPECIES: diaminopimelate decarboxylase [Persicobacter]|uniref:Diaminopimelate decarboxylase n=1 Tax=Persicobacter diffluens TaxID=981 RepID=A0AAN4VYJ7_9BACT|nr:diaminopimelate decarboxylase [Persicobacter sp. CCB-QB2]GJM62421.1 diaminopimelate decarboxylase [Persicobacter diffluens]
MELKDNAYCIQGVQLQQIAEEFGTPVYVYDADKIVSQINTLKDAFADLPLKIKYAVKSLTNLSILKLMRQNGTEVDTVSIQEVKLAMMAGFTPEEILFTPNSVSFSEIQEAVELGVVINIDNISILEQFGHTYGNSKSCCIRLNPHIMAGGNHKISTGHIDSKFGISYYQMRHILRVVKTYNMDISGLHMHTGSDILDAEVFLQGANILFEAAMEFPDLQFIDFGSGFKVAYKESDNTTDIKKLGKRLGAAFRAFCKKYGRDLEIWFEPGKYLVSESGYFLVSANTIKTTPATVFVGVNSGMNHLLRPMMYDAYHEIFNVSNPGGTKRLYSVVGYICETDTFGWDRPMNEVREGDVLAIKNAGAYGISMASNYNSRFRPAEVLVYKGKAHLIRKREEMEDLTRNQVQIEM